MISSALTLTSRVARRAPAGTEQTRGQAGVPSRAGVPGDIAMAPKDPDRDRGPLAKDREDREEKNAPTRTCGMRGN